MTMKPIPDFTRYFADEEGNVYSCIPKGCRNRFDKTKWVQPKKLKPRVLKHMPYLRIYMRRDSTNKREDVYVHRIIAELFLDNPNHYPEINHKDSNPMNNNVDNLEWCSHYYNLEYAYDYGYKARDELGRFCHK